MRLKNVVICASLGLFSAMSLSAQAYDNPSNKDIENINQFYLKRENIFNQREKVIKDISQGKNKEFPVDNIGKLEWVKSFSDYEIGLHDKGYIIKVFDDNAKEFRYFGSKTNDIWLIPKNINDFKFAFSGFNFGVHNPNPLPIKDIETIRYLSSMKGSDVLLTNPTYINYNDFYMASFYDYAASPHRYMDDRLLMKKEDFFESYIININGTFFYAKEMYLNYDNNFIFKENNVHGGYDDFYKVIEFINKKREGATKGE